MKYNVELSEPTLRELAELTGKSYSEVTRSDMNLSHTIEDYIHMSFNKLSKDNGMKRYIVSCPVMGYLEEIPHEDGEINETLLRAFDNADFGKLHDVDLEKNEYWAVRGYYSFEVEGENEKEALEKAPNVFNRLWDNGEVDCGDLIDTNRVKFKDGNKESFRISYAHEMTLSEFLVDKVIEKGFEKGTDFEDNCLFEFNVPYASTQMVSMIPCIGLTDEEINEFDPYRKTFTGTYNDIYLCFNSFDSFGISHFQITIDGMKKFDVPLTLEQREKLLEAFDYHICAYDKDKNRNILCALSKNLDETKDIAALMMKAEIQRTDRERETRNVPDIDYINIMDNDDFCIGWVCYNSDKEICEFEPNRMENILSVNGKDSDEDMFLKTIRILKDAQCYEYANLDVRRKENLTFVIPDKYVDEVMDRVKDDKRYSFSYYDYDTSLIPLARCNKPCIRNDNEVRMPVNIDKRVLSKRTNPLNSIPDDKLRDSEFFIVFGKNETYLEGRYSIISNGDTKVKIPMTANEKGYFKDIVRTKEPDFEKKIHKEKANVERD